MDLDKIKSLNLKEARELAVETHGKMRRELEQHEQRCKDGKSPAESWTEEVEKRWKQLNQVYDAAKARIEELQREQDRAQQLVEQREWLEQHNRGRRGSPDDRVPGMGDQTLGDSGIDTRDAATRYQDELRDRHLAMQAWAVTEIADHLLTDEHREACERLRFVPGQRALRLNLLPDGEFNFLRDQITRTHPARRGEIRDQLLSGIAFEKRAGSLGYEQRALSGLQGDTGGFITVPPSVIRAVEVAMVEFGAILQVAEVLTTQTGEDLRWPYVDDTSNEGAYIGESETVAEGSDPGFEQVVWRAHEITSKFIKVPNRLTRDSLPNIDQLIGRLVGERIGRFLSGEATTGSARIQGIVTRSAAGNTAAGSTSITYDDVIDLEHSVDPALRNGAAFMFHDAVLQELRKLKDGNSRPLWQSNVALGAPDTFNGKLYFPNQKMASTITSGDKTMLYGQLSAYKVRRVGPSMQLVRLVERFADARQTGFIGYFDGDGNLLRPNAAAACPVKHLVMA